MAFHFPLRGLLRLRESLERAELQKLQALAAVVARTRAEIESVVEELAAAQRRTQETIAGPGLTAAELHFELAKEAALNARRTHLEKRLADEEKLRKEQQARYFHARMQREILTNLRARRFAEYKIEEARRAQQQVDELFLTRKNVAATKQ